MATTTLTSPAAIGRPRWAATTVAPIALWTGLVLAGHLLAARLVAADPLVHIGAPPLVGHFDVRVAWPLIAAIVLACGALAYGFRLAEQLRWRSLLITSWVAGSAWIVTLAAGAGGGLAALAAPLQTRYEYLAAVPDVAGTGAAGFVRGFVEALPGYPTHVRGHPPGMVLLLSLLDHAGLGGAGWAAALVIGAGAAAAPAALVTMRALAGARAARRAAPFVTLAPAAVWLGTSADALFCGTLAIGIALLAVAGTMTARRRRVDAVALLAGLVLGAGLLLSYGLAPLGLVAVAVALATRAWRALALACAGVAAVVVAFGAAGFWWPEGLRATHALYDSGVAARRPYLDFLVISPAAFALVIGPAVFVGLARLRDRRAWILPAGALAALAVAELSGLSKGETERIWLPFAPWLLLATAALRAPRRWLAAQLALAIALQAAVRSPW